MEQSGFERIRREYLPRLEKFIADFLDKSLCAEMTSYHLETGGKRLRALIPLYVYEALGRDPIEAMPFGAAVEMVHNATLVHDDLQDGDEMRRSRPTVWKKYSAAQAINCGDAMFQYAFRLVAPMKIDTANLVRLMDRMAESTLRVIEGQAQEFAMKDERFPGVDRYLEVVRGKTSGLFGLPIVGALEALGVAHETCDVVEKAAMNLGMLFQIQDDVLDVYGKKGRDKVATDVAEGKISILVAHVNETGTADEKVDLASILRKPREQTADSDISRALAIFARTEAKNMAVGRIREIQKRLADDERLKDYAQIRQVLVELGDLFLEPLNGIL